MKNNVINFINNEKAEYLYVFDYECIQNEDFLKINYLKNMVLIKNLFIQ